MAKALKNLYNEIYIELLSENISVTDPSFKGEVFKQEVFSDKWNSLELKERMHHIAEALNTTLPYTYPNAIKILKITFNRMNHAYMLENMIFQDFVSIYGLEMFDTSMNALACFTIGSSSEFAIREFILTYPDETMKQMRVWAEDENEHLRRLASEGCRSRLPWAIALPAFKNDPTLVIEILKTLKDDSSAYVRKSVANNLNDISKDNPDILKTLVTSWIGHSKQRDAILKHGCRTLLKNSDTEVLELFGFRKLKGIEIKNFIFTQEIKMGEELAFHFDILSKEKLGKLRVEFALYFLRKNDKHNKKVFKISEADIQSTKKSISKKYSFKPISTRVYYRGEQRLSIIINGTIFKEVAFMLS